MEEYKKIINVLKKIDNDYPNEIILVLDATTGQNALNQVEEFSKIHNLTGLIITKELVSNQFKSKEEIEKTFNIQILGVIPTIEHKEITNEKK